ncbi:putative peptidyl-prolyl cis-trans isomerase [Posidoniimonas polymericola]|uniref:peptidylprolyl isomerase n=1 Tax=Posidoniimonas polymericola TaxID=2528002 RepID=A0A5C5YGZ0_9BACT|nr:peptidylprolyl isomerase [Posidoniimonas polymericola]TWT74428.1 putative peptidyl-prolyl cis-trans isomerase [Posidoniimonas polymericola]
MRTPRIPVTALVAAALMLAAPVISAQETESPPVSHAAFDAAFADYKAFMREFEDLRIQFQTANASEREQLNAKAAELVDQAKPKVKKMIDEALEVYKAAPGQDPQITELLVSAAAHNLLGNGENGQGGDQFERALEILQPLLANDEKAEGLASMGVVAAFCCNRFDLVDEYVALAKERRDDPSKLGEEMAGMVDQYSNPGMIQEYRQLWEEEEKIRSAEATANDLPRVKFETTAGDIVIELFENEAPTATANMVSLVKKGFYDGIIFHRVLPHFMAQGGDPTGTGSGGPGWSIPCECYEEDARMHFRGSLSMAHAGRDSGGSQFFLTFVPTHHLNGRHTVFGRVVEGMEVLGELQRIDPGERGVTPDKIVKATVVRDRGHAYDFKKLPGR